MSIPAPTPKGGYSWTSLVGLGLRVRVASRTRLLRSKTHFARNAAGIQHAQLRALLRRAARTAFGRAHAFERLAGIDDPRARLEAYRAEVPLRDWYAFKDDIAQMRAGGEADVLWPGKVTRFAQTSGTTAGDKFIPVSDAMMKSNYRASLDIFATMATWGVSIPRVLGGRCLFLGGSSDLSHNEHGIATGDLSGLVTPLIRWPLSAIYSPGPDIALMSHWPDKIDAMARLALEQDIRFISGMPSWALVLMERVLELARARGRAAARIRDVWPNLEIFVHGGVKYAPFEPRVNEIVEGDAGVDLPHRLELYPASEAFVAIQDRIGEPGLRLLVDNDVFFEFVPIEQIDRPDAEAFTCDAVERGQRYVVVLTTCAGLWRYIIGDVVEFDSIPARFGDEPRPGDGPPRLRIVGRHKHFINAFGENVIVEHVEHAVAEAARDSGLSVGEFTAAPVYPSPGVRSGLELACEFTEAPTPDRLARFADAFDAALKSINVDYTTKRTESLGMAPPTVTPLALGAFHRWLQSRGKLGGQHKCPRCANSREILESVLASGRAVSTA